MRNGFIIDTLTSADFQEIVKIGGYVKEIYEKVVYRENFKINPFRNVIDKLFALRQKYKDENIEVLQILVKLLFIVYIGDKLEKILKKV